MHPMLRNVVIGMVALIIAGALTALALSGRDSDLSVLGLLGAGIIGALVGLFLYAQGWVWGSRAARQRDTGQAVLIAVGAGIMALVAAVGLVLWRRVQSASADARAGAAAALAVWTVIAGHGLVDSFLSFTTTYVTFALAGGWALSRGLVEGVRHAHRI